MDNKIDKADKENRKDLKILEDFLRKGKTGVTISEITVGTGLASHWVEPTLRKLMKKYACHVEFDKHQELVYIFDFQHSLKNSIWQKYLLNTAQFVLRILFFTFLLLWKIIGLLFFLSYILSLLLMFMLSVPVLIFAYPLLWVIGKITGWKAEDLYDYSWDGAMDVIGVIFGDDIWDLPDFFAFKLQRADKLAIEKRLLELIGLQKGFLTVSDIIRMTGWGLEKAQEEAIQLVANYQGTIEVDSKGVILYEFPHLEQQQIPEEDIDWAWKRPLTLEYFDWDFYGKLFRGFLTTFVLVAIPLWLVFLTKDNEVRPIFIVAFSFPLYPYLAGIGILTIKMPCFFWRIAQRKKYNRKLQFLEIVFDKLTRDEGISIHQDFQKITQNQKFVQKFLMSYEPELVPKADGNTYVIFPDFARELLWRSKNLSFERTFTVLMDENFENNNLNWAEDENEKRTLKVGNGAYVFEHKRKEGAWTTHYDLPELDEKEDFLMETQIEYIKGNNFEGFGLVWGREDFENQYSFCINNNQKFIIDKEGRGNYENWTGWIKNENLKKGFNDLKVRKIRNTLKFYINEEKIYERTFEPFFGTKIGFYIGADLKIKIHNLKILQYDSGEKKQRPLMPLPVLFEENFENNKHKWAEDNHEKALMKLEKGYYVFQNKTDDYYWSSHKGFPELDENSNFTIETTLEYLEGKEKEHFGLVWGRKDGDNHYSFCINHNKKFIIDQTGQGTYQAWTSWEDNPHIDGVSNHLKIEKSSDKLKFYINGHFVYQHNFRPFYGSRVGFTIGNRVKIKAHHFKITQ